MKQIDELRSAEAPVLVERGRDESVLIIAFTGFIHRLSLRVYEFFDATKHLGYSRILLRDQYRVWYQHGIDRERPDFPSLVQYLSKEVADLNPQKVICLGTSSGGYAAILAGHQLKADYVHAFAPDTFLKIRIRSCLAGLWKGRYQLPRWKLLLSKRARPELFDLAKVLRDHNGRTTYFVHHCSGHERDRVRTARISGMPGVVSIAYPCNTHSVAVFLGKKGFLPKILDISNQDRIVALARSHFAGEW